EVRIPNAMPFFFTALKLVSSVAVIAAIVAEYFGGRVNALGPLIIQNASSTRFDDAWAAVLAGSLLGLSLFGIASFLERIAMPWQRAIGDQS
ncbi:MAG: ABC transporter permease subunit, partial [Acidimicrobiales bacterium]